MKVCFITANYPPEACGGTEQVVVALARELQARGVEVSAISGSDVPYGDPLTGGKDVHHEHHQGVAVTRMFKRTVEHDVGGYVRPRLLAQVSGRLRQLQPDIVHVHSFAGLGLGIGAVCDELAVPMVVTCHDLWTTCARFFRLPAGGVSCPTGSDRAACVTCVNDALQTDVAFVTEALQSRHRLVSEELDFASRCTAPSRTAAQLVRSRVPFADEIDVIPHGLLRPVPGSDRAPSPQLGERLRIGTFGGLVAEKGVRELLLACRGLDCELHLAGPFHEDDFAGEIRRLAAEQGTQLVERGRYASSERHPARDLHLAVFPSKCQETYGLVVDEALAHGVPAVLSDQGAFAERAGTPGIVVTPLDALSTVLRELVGSPERLLAQRSAIPTELPTMAVSAQRHLDLYRSLA